MATPTWTIAVFIVVSVFSAFATFFLKLAAPTMSLSVRKLIRNWRLIIGLFLYGIATLISLVALKFGELSVLYPFVALQYVWVNFLSKKYLGEELTLLKWAGVVLIFLGVTLVGLGA